MGKSSAERYIYIYERDPKGSKSLNVKELTHQHNCGQLWTTGISSVYEQLFLVSLLMWLDDTLIRLLCPGDKNSPRQAFRCRRVNTLAQARTAETFPFQEWLSLVTP